MNLTAWLLVWFPMLITAYRPPNHTYTEKSSSLLRSACNSNSVKCKAFIKKSKNNIGGKGHKKGKFTFQKKVRTTNTENNNNKDTKTKYELPTTRNQPPKYTNKKMIKEVTVPKIKPKRQWTKTDERVMGTKMPVPKINWHHGNLKTTQIKHTSRTVPRIAKKRRTSFLDDVLRLIGLDWLLSDF